VPYIHIKEASILFSQIGRQIPSLDKGEEGVERGSRDRIYDAGTLTLLEILLDLCRRDSRIVISRECFS